MEPCLTAFHPVVADWFTRQVGPPTDVQRRAWPIIAGGELVDLSECGVNVLNPQYRANGLDKLVASCKGKICLNLDLDRQLFPFCTPADLDDHIRGAVEALGAPEGGLWLSAEIGPEVPLANVRAIIEALERYRGYFAG